MMIGRSSLRASSQTTFPSKRKASHIQAGAN